MVNNISEASPNIIVSSGICDDEILPAIGPESKEFPKLLSWIKETDHRLIVHVEWAVRIKLCKQVVVIPNDTDTLALLLHYIPHWIGIEELWQQYGTGEKRRMIPLHDIVAHHGMPLS